MAKLAGSTIEEKLLLNSTRDGECLRWTGAHVPSGYGQIRHQGRTRQVHVVAYEERVGPIPVGLEIDHVKAHGCRFRDCIEADHLEAVTHAENVRRSLPTHCPQGHELTADNVKATPVKRGKYRGRRCRTCFNAARNAGRREQRAAARRLTAEASNADPIHQTEAPDGA